jgi:Protein of unknown function (DUF732)
MRRSILLGSRVAAVAMCVASTVIAAPAPADPSASDGHAGYLFTLDRLGLHLSRDDAFAQGVGVCLVSSEPGETLSDVVTQVSWMHPTWNRIDAKNFVGAAEDRYCPDKLARGAHGAVCSPDETSAASFETVGLRDGNRRPRSQSAPRDYEIAGGQPYAPYEVLR